MRKSQSSRGVPTEGARERLAKKLDKAGAGARQRAVADIEANGTAEEKAALAELSDRYKS